MSAAQQSSFYTENLRLLFCWLVVSATCLILGAFFFAFTRVESLMMPLPTGLTTIESELPSNQTATRQDLFVSNAVDADESAGSSQIPLEPSSITMNAISGSDIAGSDSEIFDAAHGHYPQADFSRTNLRSANFNRASLTDASFDGALLMHATLRVANIRHSRFLDADLSFSDLGDSEATGAVFNGAVLRHANASRANLIGTSFEYANMFAINLQQSWLLKASLRGAVLADAQLSEANLQHVDFTHTDLSVADLSGADLRYSNITERQLATACGSKKTLLPESLQNYTMRACP